MTEKITSFHGSNHFLSNFYPSKVTATWNDDKVTVATVEHAFQAAKAMNRKDFDAICKAATPGQAKKLGRKCVMRSGWEAVRMDVMEKLLREKFSDNVMKAMLLGTGDATLIEGNTWGDQYWGVCDGKGENHLGRLLMKVRDEIASTMKPKRSPDPKKYPEHAKLHEVADKTQFVHDFLTFCEEKGIYLMKDDVYQRHDKLLYEYTEIDQWKLDDEKRAMIEEFRSKTE